MCPLQLPRYKQGKNLKNIDFLQKLDQKLLYYIKLPLKWRGTCCTWVMQVDDFSFNKFRLKNKNTYDEAKDTRLCLFERRFLKEFWKHIFISVTISKVFLIFNRILAIRKSSSFITHIQHVHRQMLYTIWNYLTLKIF